MDAEDTLSSFLVTTVHLQQDLELPSRDHDAAQAVSEAPRRPGRQHPPLTRVYQTSWHLFC